MNYDWRTLILAGPAILFSLTVHEYFHARIAFHFGDTTARDAGRLTLNPLAHLDLMGTLMLVISGFRFGWAKPVPVNPYFLQGHRSSQFWIAAAGPLSNLGLALLAGTAFRLIGDTAVPHSLMPLIYMLWFMIICNISLAFFNLLPISPLDGSHIFRHLLPEQYGPLMDQVERYSPMVLMVLIASGFIMKFSILMFILGPFIKGTVYLFSGIRM
jgi:Zn-dependent protease